MGEVVRIGRHLNLPLGAAIALLPWFTENASAAYSAALAVAGAVIALASIPRGPKRESYGSWDRFVR